jgi:GT2 family glycosyltransferase
MIMCSIDELTEKGVRGWAIDEARPERPVLLHALVDGEPLLEIICSQVREDVAAAGFKSERVGYSFKLPESVIDGQPHRLELRCRLGDMTVLYQGGFVQEVPFRLEYPLHVHSYVDGLTHGVLRGWLVSARGEERLTGGRDILVTCNDEVIGQIRANRYRGDVGKALSADPNCGFQFKPPAHARSPYPKPFRFFLLPERIELDNSPYVTSFITDQREATALHVIEQIDRMHADLTKLRRQVRSLMPDPGHTLADYENWLPEHLADLRTRVERKRSGVTTRRIAAVPLVSIIMPVYRPKLAEFEAAVASVIGQTSPDWELVVVDDQSGDDTLSEAMRRFSQADERVRLAVRDENGGISRATNDGIDLARGRWVMFFDHDDLLVDVAVEHMLAEAERTGAKLIYSDEDKIDASGHFSDPAFKTDWNYRLLLGVNYICHLVMVEREVLAAAGALDPARDGAQDHDLLLRLSELLPEARIHHVPEILYHWRMSETSTAASIGNKRYAVEAGRSAIAAHLERRGLPAEVTPIDDMTLYKVDWQFPRLASEVAKVSVIVPFKDEIGITRRCLDRLLTNTDYPNFEITLVDNWSMTAEANAFVAKAEKTDGVRVLRVREPFNYARLNNLASAESDADFLMFLNNDVLVENRSWLNVLVGEMLADPACGVVGGKFLYPNGTVQHAGVVLGVGDVAGHAHVGIPATEGGYAGRASFTQEMSAVTAAGMLVRAAAFRAVGGFDEVDLAVAFNDIDLCLRIRGAGYRVIWTPDFVAEHHESLSRGSDDRPIAERRFFHERETMIERYGDALKQDPFYSPHFALDRQPFFDLVTPGLSDERYRPHVGIPKGGQELPAAPAFGKPKPARRRARVG